MPKKYNKGSFSFKSFQPEFLNEEQKKAYEIYKESDVMFLLGPAGSGKTHLAVSFAIKDILSKDKNKLFLSRPVVEAGENLGFLPGDLTEKCYPYMLPIFDCFEKVCGGKDSEVRQYIDDKYELAPLAFMRGRTFDNSIAVLDEAQNCTASQLKLFLTRLGRYSKMIVTGDPAQTDIFKNSGLMTVIEKLRGVPGIGYYNFTEEAIVRHPLVIEMVKRL